MIQGGANGKAKKQKAEQPRPEKQNNAIYVTSLPDDVTEDELSREFHKYGVIAESADSDAPRIKLYYDDNGKFKGEALIGELTYPWIPLCCLHMTHSVLPLRIRPARNQHGR